MKKITLSSPIVSAAWLAEHLDHPDIIILDASIKKVTASDHVSVTSQIKNARFFDIKNTFSDKTNSIPNMLPTPEVFAKGCEELGISSDHTIIIYDTLGIYSSPRAWWMFKTMGHENVAVLDGGLPVWVKSGYPTTSVEKRSHFSTTHFKTSFRPEHVASVTDIMNSIHHTDNCILDARSKGRFEATAPEPRADLKGGHIPNSISLPYTSVLSDDGTILSTAQLQSLFNSLPIANKKLIFSCGSGITACIILLASQLAGYPMGVIYDGSWSEWGQLPNVPITS
ncbi:sulfurtransferase [Aquimarina sp. TRL1]|uniref:sulfurtransferase n=1 Tax=Aquimarina sp. (strain TRL1) TaxID=2736252 RepID=UPI00158B7C27|nr:sulfurtransferase [Aquimarina sp. TRL1]QKX04754.1 sulfurtransferase [Aquimarina sp. TRL1]